MIESNVKIELEWDTHNVALFSALVMMHTSDLDRESAIEQMAIEFHKGCGLTVEQMELALGYVDSDIQDRAGWLFHEPLYTGAIDRAAEDA